MKKTIGRAAWNILMVLPTQMLERITGTHEPLHQTTKAAVLPVGCRRRVERRQSPRIAFGKRSQISRDKGPFAGKWETVLLKEISQGGIGLLTQTPFSVGDTFIMKLPQSDGAEMRIRCATRRCEAGGFGGVSFLVGASFEQVIEESEICVNDDHDGPPSHWEEPSQAAERPHNSNIHPTNAKSAAASFAKAAMNLLKAASHFTHRHDDFSSA